MGCVRPACAATSGKRENEGSDEGSETANAAEMRGAQTEPAPASTVRRNRRREEKLAMVLRHRQGAGETPEPNIFNSCRADLSVGSIRIAFCTDSRASVYRSSL